MSFFKKLYFKIWNGVRNISLKIGLYKFAHNMYAKLVGIAEIRLNRQSKKRANGWIDKRYIKIKEYENIHEGKRCFIVCSGPSLTVEDVGKLKNEYTFSMNSIVKLYSKTDWRPTYYIIADPMVFDKLKSDPVFSSLQNRFITNLIVKQIVPLKTDVVFPICNYDFLKYGAPKKFSPNVYSISYGGASVVYNIMQIAVYMGFKEIYLLGCDCNYSGEKQHVVDYDAPKQGVDSESLMIKTYRVAKKYCDAHGIKIFNATRGGKLEVFPRVDFDTLFDKNE